MLLKSKDAIINSDNEQAQDILAKMLYALSAEVPSGNVDSRCCLWMESAYTRFLGIGGPVLTDSYHLGRRSATTTDGLSRRVSTDYGSFDGGGVGTVFVVREESTSMHCRRRDTRFRWPPTYP
jgi:hypothetical protein